MPTNIKCKSKTVCLLPFYALFTYSIMAKVENDKYNNILSYATEELTCTLLSTHDKKCCMSMLYRTSYFCFYIHMKRNNKMVKFIKKKYSNSYLPRYRSFMAMFGPCTRHLVLNAQNCCLGSEAVHRTQHKLHLLDPDIFPLLRDVSVPAVWNAHPPVPKTNSPIRLKGLEELKNKVCCVFIGILQ